MAHSSQSLLLAGCIIVILGLSSSTSSSSSSSLSSKELQDVFSRALLSNATSTFGRLAGALRFDWSKDIASKNVPSCLEASSSVSAEATADCLVETHQCLPLTEVASLYALDVDGPLNRTDVQVLSPAMLFSLMSCYKGKAGDVQDSSDKTPSSEAAWGYSFLFVTLINLCSLTGALVLPCMKLKIYKRVLMFMVALAVGTLAGSGLLFLIPEAFLLVHDDSTDYIWKATTIGGGIYLFYLIEKLLRAINAKRENTRQKKRQDELATEGHFSTSFQRQTIHTPIPQKNPDTIPDSITNGICSSVHREVPYLNVTNSASSVTVKDLGLPTTENGTEDPVQSTTDSTMDEKNHNNVGDIVRVNVQDHHHHSHSSSSSQDVAPVAYMIIFGDALHNFIDGLSIGSAFTQSIMTGVSVSVAVMCEELPHELGDFAILLNSGMRIKKAILYNFLSACTCYLGTVIGITLGENTHSHEWIFALAGGMFLYISLVDMLPEMNASSESEEGKKLGAVKVFLIHNLGLLTGYAIMLIMALFSGSIEFN